MCVAGITGAQRDQHQDQMFDSCQAPRETNTRLTKSDRIFVFTKCDRQGSTAGLSTFTISQAARWIFVPAGAWFIARCTGMKRSYMHTARVVSRDSKGAIATLFDFGIRSSARKQVIRLGVKARQHI